MKHFGDITKINGHAVPIVDCVIGGSPCQDLSVAGKRAGLAGERSGLFMEQIRIIKEMRDESKRRSDKYVRPRFAVWENVFGAFSSNGGEDFRCVLEEFCRIADPSVHVPRPANGRWQPAGEIMGDGWSLAWRTHDAQYWGVPQRRRRISVIMDFGTECAGEILFECAGLSGYSAEGFRAWQRTANGTEDGIGTPGIGLDGYNGSVSDKAATLGVNCGMSTGRNGVVLNDQGGSRMDITEEVTCTLRAEAHHPPCILYTIALENHPNDGRIKIEEDGKVQTLSTRMGTGGNNVPLVMNVLTNWDGGQIAPTLTKQNAGGNQRMPDKDNFNCILEPFGISAHDSNAMKSQNPHSGIYEADTSRTLDLNGGNPACNQGGIAIVESYACDFRNSKISEVNGTLQAHPSGGGSVNLNNVVMEQVIGFLPQHKAESMAPMVEKSPCLTNGTNPGWQNGVMTKTGMRYIVRRLTPMECERLQGFPDGWTDIGTWTDTKGKKHETADSARYKALGNSIALPFWRFLLRRISAEYLVPPTMCSLFDGIGGFPLIWESINGKGTAVWASEIEEFPIAVTKYHFGGE